MSRSIRDLRDFISVSRLSFRDSDGEEETDGDGPKAIGLDDFQDNKTFASLEDTGTSLSNHCASAISKSPDVAITCNQQMQLKRDEIVVGRPKSSVGMRRPPSSLSSYDSTRSRPHTPLMEQNLIDMSDSSRNVDICSERLENCGFARVDESSRLQNYCDKNKQFSQEMSSIEDIFCFLDVSVINSWLERSNKQLDCITNWLQQNNNFLKFAHFLLSDFDSYQRRNFLEMEISIILDEFQLAFRVGIDSKKVKLKDLVTLMSIVLKEYPRKLFSIGGVTFILDVLFIFCSGKSEHFKSLLSDVRYSTENKQIAQWLLAIRAFSLIGLCNGILEFFKSLSKTSISTDSEGDTLSGTESPKSRISTWLFSSIELEYFDVLKYFLQKDPQMSNIVDGQGRNLIFKAVVNEKEQILNFLIQKVSPKIDINRCSKSGNSPLHAAVSKGNITIIKLLIENGANVNHRNNESKGATPLHTAVMNGDLRIVKLLVEGGADSKLAMGSPASVTPADLAKDLGNETIWQYLLNK